MDAPHQAPVTGEVRLAELLAALSLATDLADGFPPETALKTCLIAVTLGRELDISGDALSDVYYAALLRYLGCTSTAHESNVAFGGDDVLLRGAFAGIDPEPHEFVRALRELGRRGGRPARTLAGFAVQVMTDRDSFWRGLAADCEAQSFLARRLGLGEEVAAALEHGFASWNGKLYPRGVAGERIPIAGRISYCSHLIEQHLRRGGDRRTVLMKVRRWAGGQVDPQVAGAFLRRGDELLELVAPESVWDAVLEAEPEPRPWIPASRLDRVVQAFGDFADLKSVYYLGHSSGVAKLASTAATVCGLADFDVAAIRKAGHLHDLGRVAVSNGIWDKRGTLNAAEWERVRLHPYHTERVLTHSPALAPLARLAGSDHERLDGSGYHRGLSAGAIPKTARILAAADAYQAMVEERPYRAALTPLTAAAQLNAEASAGRLDVDAVRAVLVAAGQTPSSRRGQWPAGLSDREVQVLRLAAQARTNQEIGRTLSISPRTVHHHVQHIYQKIGVSSRAAAALYAMEHDLLGG